MNRRPIIYALITCLLVPSLTSAESFIQAGRIREAEPNFRMAVTLGSVEKIEGMVQETTRKLYTVRGEDLRQGRADRFDLNDFNMEGPYTSFGIAMERIGRFFSWQFDVSIFQPDTEAIARRDYLIGVGDPIVYEGKEYTNLKILDGETFSADMIAGQGEFRLLCSPFSIQAGDKVRITPWAAAGLFAFIGSYEIDAGEPVGTVVHMVPPEEFVIGGRSEGMVGLALPELGFGGEIRIGTPQTVTFALQGHISTLEFSGSTSYFVSSEHREKNIDLKHENYRVRALVEIPMENGNKWFFGAQMDDITSAAEITVPEGPDEEIIARHEKWDKIATFDLSTIKIFAGFTF